MSIMTLIKINIVKYLFFVFWKCQEKYLEITHLERKHKKVAILPECNKNLILIPHADDEWIGCSQLIASKKSEGFFFNFSGKNRTLNNKMLRLSELEKISTEMEFNFVSSKDNVEQELFDYLKENNGCAIFLPSFLDWHIEHLHVNYILQKEINQLLKLGCQVPSFIYLYQISVPLPFKWINAYLPLTKNDQKQKWATFSKYYISQSHLPVDRYKIQEQINGFYCNCYAAEVFCKMDYEEWNRRLNVLKKREILLGGLQTNINNIVNIHKDINSIDENENWNS